MSKVGEALRQARIRRDLTLEDCERSVRIAMRYLDALEREDWSAFPAPVYTRAFLRTYASFLGLEPATLVSEIPGQDGGGWARAFRRLVPQRAADAPPESYIGTSIILITDVVESTQLMEQMGDSAFRSRSRDLDIILRSIIRRHSGVPIEGKLLGDGVLSVFTSGRDAIVAALACTVAGSNAALPLHVGVHAGDIIRERHNVYGTAVNIASRISSASAPGEVLVSDVVRSLARTSANVEFEDRGMHSLKGIAEPQRLFAVRAREA